MLKLQGKEVTKKRTIVIESSSSSNNEVTLPLLEEELYTALKATPKND
jgi:hypothetical protein